MKYKSSVRLADFLIAVLETHGNTLNRLAALFTEEILIEILERAGEAADDRAMQARDAGQTRMADPNSRLKIQWLEPQTSNLSGSVYLELETAVSDFRISPVLEFHLWAYPYYRQWIECPTDLSARLDATVDGATVSRLAEDAMADAQSWIRALPISPDFGQRAELASQAAWIRFRAELLKKAGLRPMASTQI